MKTATAKDVHNECDAQAKTLIKEASVIIAKAQKKDNALIAKIKEMGFINSSSIKENEQALKIANAALRYKLLYPQNNFLTEEAIEKICKKYGLLFAGAKDFIGEIPIKNQIEMANFKLAEEDKMVLAIDKKEFKNRIGRIKAGKRKLKTTDFINSLGIMTAIFVERTRYEKIMTKKEFSADGLSLRKELKPEFKVIATTENISMVGKEVVGEYKVVDKDPVVFCKVSSGYLQVSCWGDEASLEEFKVAPKN